MPSHDKPPVPVDADAKRQRRDSFGPTGDSHIKYLSTAPR